MKITTYARFEWDGKEYVQVDEESYEYDGPLALCGMSDGPGDDDDDDSRDGRGMPGDDPSVTGGGWEGFGTEGDKKGGSFSFGSFVDDLLGLVGLGSKYSRTPADVEDDFLGSLMREKGLPPDIEKDIRQTIGKMNASRIGKIFGGITGLGLPDLGIGSGMNLGGMIGKGAYGMFGDPSKPSSFTDKAFSFESPGPMENITGPGQSRTPPAEMLAGIFGNKGNVDVNEFINSLLNRGTA